MATDHSVYLDKVDDLRVFPAAAVRVREVSTNKNSSAADLERAVGLDPMLASRLLKIANTAFYGPGRASNLREAILRVGFHTTRDLATALSLASMSELPQVRHQNMWAHAVRVGVGARRIARWCHQPPDTMFIAGLLHDLGQLLLLLCEPKKYDAMLEGRAQSVALLRDEREEFGIDHAELGANALARWGFDGVALRAVRFHHAPGEAPGNEAMVVAFADYLAVLHLAKGASPRVLRASKGAIALGLTDRVESILEDYDSDIREFDRWGGGMLADAHA